MSVQEVEPTLTVYDKRVLAAIPGWGEEDYRRRGFDGGVTIWQIAEALDVVELNDVRLTLGGLQQLGYVWSARSRSRNRMVYWRTPKGDGAVA